MVRGGSVWLGIVCFALFTPLADWLVVPPRWTPLPAPPDQIRRMIPGAGGQVEVWERRSAAVRAGRRPLLRVLCFCGQGDRAQQKRWDLVDMLDDVPVGFWTMNYPGYGGTSGPSRLSRVAPLVILLGTWIQRVGSTFPVGSRRSGVPDPTCIVDHHRGIHDAGRITRGRGGTTAAGRLHP